MPRRLPLPLGAPLLVCLLLASCGGEAEEGGGEGGKAGVPDVADRPTEADLLSALSERVTTGEGISDASWSGDVMAVALGLWPDGASEEDLQARRDHANLAHITGDMAGQLRREEGAREAWMERDPTSVRIHDGFVEAAGRGVDAFRDWVTGEGRRLLRERLESLMGDGPPR